MHLRDSQICYIVNCTQETYRCEVLHSSLITLTAIFVCHFLYDCNNFVGGVPDHASFSLVETYII